MVKRNPCNSASLLLKPTGTCGLPRRYLKRGTAPCRKKIARLAPLTLETLTPIAIIGYRNELQHAQHKSISTINMQVSALRAWCGWMTKQGYLTADPAAHLKLVGGEAASSRTGLKSAQVNEVGRGSLRKSITRSGISMVFPALEQGKVWYSLGRDGVCVDTERMGLTVTLLRSRVIFDWAGITRDSQI